MTLAPALRVKEAKVIEFSSPLPSQLTFIQCIRFRSFVLSRENIQESSSETTDSGQS
jgi:hypothetical protein